MGPGSRESQTSGCPEKGLVGTSLWTPCRVRVRACVLGGAAEARLELEPRPVRCGPGRPGSEALGLWALQVEASSGRLDL